MTLRWPCALPLFGSQRHRDPGPQQDCRALLLPDRRQLWWRNGQHGRRRHRGWYGAWWWDGPRYGRCRHGHWHGCRGHWDGHRSWDRWHHWWDQGACDRWGNGRGHGRRDRQHHWNWHGSGDRWRRPWQRRDGWPDRRHQRRQQHPWRQHRARQHWHWHWHRHRPERQRHGDRWCRGSRHQPGRCGHPRRHQHLIRGQRQPGMSKRTRPPDIAIYTLQWGIFPRLCMTPVDCCDCCKCQPHLHRWCAWRSCTIRTGTCSRVSTCVTAGVRHAPAHLLIWFDYNARNRSQAMNDLTGWTIGYINPLSIGAANASNAVRSGVKGSRPAALRWISSERGLHYGVRTLRNLVRTSQQ